VVNNFLKSLVLALVVLISACGKTTKESHENGSPWGKQESLPNVIIIYTDDQAQWALGAYGNNDIHTPNIDRLASEGMLFTRGFTKPVCSPSRVMLLTGRYSHRFDIPDFIPTDSKRGLPPGTPTIASILKRKGYATGLFGKWHLGYGEKFYPNNFGFDVAEGYRHLKHSKEEMLTPIDGTYIKYQKEFRLNPLHTDILADRAIDFIRTNQQKPFFLYLATHFPHLPWHPIPEHDEERYRGQVLSVPDTSDFKGLTKKTVTNTKLQDITRKYYACISNVDRNIGKILNVLDQQHLSENTILLFIGDNGFMIGHHGTFGKGNARKMYIDEKGKFTTRNNGTRPNMFDDSILVPFIVRWPGVIEPGTKNDEMVSTIDVLPTLIEAVGINTSSMQLDGQSLLPLFREDADSRWRTSYYDTYDMIHLGNNGEQPYMRMVRTNDWKFILYQDENGSPLANGTRHELFNLKADPKESSNLYGKKVVNDIQKKLEAQLKKWMKENQLK